MTEKTNHQAHAELNDQLAAQLGALDADLEAGPAIPGAPPPPNPEQERAEQAAAEVAEVADMLALGVNLVAQWEPLAQKHLHADWRKGWAEQYVECANRYGWTLHKQINADPRVGLFISAAVPVFMIIKERRSLQAAAAEKAAAEGEPSNGEPSEAGPAPAGDDGRVR